MCAESVHSQPTCSVQALSFGTVTLPGQCAGPVTVAPRLFTGKCAGQSAMHSDSAWLLWHPGGIPSRARPGPQAAQDFEAALNQVL